MGIKERKEREWHDRRNLILAAAADILANEGEKELSVRKIANKIEYSPAIIYHYFANKDDIMQNLLQEQYTELTGIMQNLQAEIKDPEERIREMLKAYAGWALKRPSLYRAVLLNDSPLVLKSTSVLKPGAAQTRPAIDMLQAAISELKGTSAGTADYEAVSQVIWAAIYGLIIRIIIEKPPEAYVEKLITQYLDLVMHSLNATC